MGAQTRQRIGLAIACVVTGFIAGCGSSSSSPRCQRVCGREAEAAAATSGETDYQFSRGECERNCELLERSEQGRKRVTEHEACVTAAAANHEAVLACE